jgi:hypothetical protein
MISFVELINQSFNILTKRIWTALCHRLSLSVSPKQLSDRITDLFLYEKHSCSFTEGSPFDGIISYLTRKFGGHVADRGVVSINASSVHGSSLHLPGNVADFANQTCGHTTNEANSWIGYDFKTMRIKPTHYSLRSRRDVNGYYMRSWTVEGSIDGQSWIELDRRENTTGLIGLGANVTFSISKLFEIQMIRVRQLDTNTSGDHWFCINAIEIFGIILERKQ